MLLGNGFSPYEDESIVLEDVIYSDGLQNSFSSSSHPTNSLIARIILGSINSDIPDTQVCNSSSLFIDNNIQENTAKTESLSEQARIEPSPIIQHSESSIDITHPGYISTKLCHLCQALLKRKGGCKSCICRRNIHIKCAMLKSSCALTTVM